MKYKAKQMMIEIEEKGQLIEQLQKNVQNLEVEISSKTEKLKDQEQSNQFNLENL